MSRDEEYDDRRPGRRTGDLIVKPQEFAFILDETKGQVSVIVGPQKMSLAGTDKTVIYDPKLQRFTEVDLDRAVATFVSASRGSYVELQNPAKRQDNEHPTLGTISNLAELDHGCKVNLPGPCNFPLWPGQVVAVLEGHNLRSNQYLICRVYDDDAAKANIKHAVIKATSEEEGGEAKTREAPNLLPAQDELVTGKLFIIKGTDVSFFIPPNGIEVLPDSENRYIRDAVTLEQLEYCILLDENGGKRFERGPQVVFPKPTERFLKRTVGLSENKRSAPDTKRTTRVTRRFRAIELNDISGIYVKVIAAYEENGKKYSEGEELWITGKEQRIYFPRPEHSLIKYGDREIHYAVAVPKGESKYVLNRETGEITLIRGPAMFLPDPRKEVLARRILDADQARTWFPGNAEVAEYNAELAAAGAPGDKFITERQLTSKKGDSRVRSFAKSLSGGSSAMSFASGSMRGMEDIYENATAAVTPYDEGNFNDEPSSSEHAGETIGRHSTFTPPVMVAIDSKLDGAVIVRPWTGYAIQVVDGEGNRRVVQGPAVVHLEYDEALEEFTLSTGKTKSTDKVIRDVYLRVLNNRVSDTVVVETSDMVKVEVALSYRVNFEGDPNKWFDVENYVQHLCDNMRSILRNVAKQVDIQAFYSNYIEIIRNTIIPQNEDGVRPGRPFDENGMRITEVEVLNCQIGDAEIQQMLEDAQQETAQALIQLNQGQKQFELEEANARLQRARAELRTLTDAALEEQRRQRLLDQEKTREFQHGTELQGQKRSEELERAILQQRLEVQKAKDGAELARQSDLDAIAKSELARTEAETEQRLKEAQAKTRDYIDRLRAEAQKQVETAGAVQPGLVEALTALGQAGMLEKLTGELAPLAIVQGMSVGGAIKQLLEGTPFESAAKKLVANVEGGNGSWNSRFETDRPTHDGDRF